MDGRLSQELYLVNNKLTKIQGIENLTKLKLLECAAPPAFPTPTLAGGTLASLLASHTPPRHLLAPSWPHPPPYLDRYGSNRLRTIENLGTLTNITELWLG